MNKPKKQSKHIGLIVVVAMAAGVAAHFVTDRANQANEAVAAAPSIVNESATEPVSQAVSNSTSASVSNATSTSEVEVATDATGRPIVSTQFNALLSPVGRDTPTFELLGADGSLWNNEALKGKPWIVNFWAVWCAPCIKEIPSMNRAWEKVSDKGVGMLAINIGEDANGIQDFLNEHNLTIDFPVVIGDKTKTLGNWSVANLPASIIIDANGNLVYEAIGPREWDEDAILKPITDLVVSP